MQSLHFYQASDVAKVSCTEGLDLAHMLSAAPLGAGFFELKSDLVSVDAEVMACRAEFSAVELIRPMPCASAVYQMLPTN